MLIPDDLDMELDEFVELFEEARAARADVDVADFMPSPQHPRYAQIGCELLRVDMELHAASGRLISAAEYQQRFPQVCEQSIHLQALQSEESRVRAASHARSSKSNSSITSRKSGSHARYDPGTSRLGTSRDARDAAMPVAGESVCGFQLHAELGRGAFSRVYLAADNSLAQRRVVLKVSSQLMGEADTLSRLQHKNIVPVYSLHRVNQYHMICMPFLGTLTLADLLKASHTTTPGLLSGRALISTLAANASRTWKNDGNDSVTSATVGSEAEHATEPGLSSELTSQVARMSTVELALWIVSELADGLAHAHERGILHRDIKPANILLSDDGLPMLLDFNLAAYINPKDNHSDVMGGTLRYMAPEQIAAVRDRLNCLDARADVYSLGVVLYELLWQRPPFNDRTGRWADVLQQMDSDRQKQPPLNVAWGSGVTPAVISILKRCLTYRPEDRYQSSAQLRDDLRAHLQAKPLRYAADRSVRERLHKWNVRHPRLSSLTLATVLAASLLIGTTAWFLNRQSSIDQLQATSWYHALRDAQTQSRNLLASENAPASEIRRLFDQSDDVLTLPLVQRHLSKLSPADVTAANNTLARVHFYRARGAIGMSSRVPPSERTAWLKRANEELHLSQSYADLPMTNQWLTAIGPLLTGEKPSATSTSSRTQLVSLIHNVPALEEELAAAKLATQEEASNPWHWLGVGQMQLSLGKVAPAHASFTLGHSLDQQNMLPAFYLGVVEMKRRDFAAADEWFSYTFALDPKCSEALINRAASRVELKRYADAIQDIDALGEQVQRYPRAWFIRELAEQRLGRLAAAVKSRKQGLSLEPLDALGWNARGEAKLRSAPPDAIGALADFDQAVLLDANLRNAYENAAHVLSERLQRPKEAIERLGAAVKVDANYALAWSSRAVLNARSGAYAAARSDAEQALQLDRSPMICYQCASALAIIEAADTNNSADYQASKPTKEQEFNHDMSSLQLLKETLRKEPSLSKFMRTDQDLRSLLNNPQFEELIFAATKLQ